MIHNHSTLWDEYPDRHFNIPEQEVQKEILEDLLEWCTRRFDKSFELLDIGQGNGRLLKRFDGSIPVEVTMVDFSEKGRRLAKENTGILPDKWDGVTLPYEDNSFDLVVLFEVLLHVDHALVEQVWNEVKRVSRQYIFATAVNFPKDSYFCFNHYYGSLFIHDRSIRVIRYEGEKFPIAAWYIGV